LITESLPFDWDRNISSIVRALLGLLAIDGAGFETFNLALSIATSSSG
jgi:hypothetical protein